MLNEDCYFIRLRTRETGIARDIETHYCTMGDVADVVPEEAKDGVLREPVPRGLPFEETLLAKRKRAAARDVVNKNMHYVNDWCDLSDEAAALIVGAGCDGVHADLDELKRDRY